MKTKDLLAAIFCLLIGREHLQVNGATYELPYKPNVFDDQYIGCADELAEDIMPAILTKEKENRQFEDAWKTATKVWNKMAPKLDLPDGFEDEYGIALLVFTNQIPKGNPIYQQLNANLALAGASVKDYEDHFHFKALHFYLTRALQILKPDCSPRYVTFRGSEDTYEVSPLFKFGRFTSTSLNSTTAQTFGTASSFQITTCFGANIGQLSFFPEEDEVLIPPTEQFTYVMKKDSAHILESTGQMCSYFNCAIKGGEKQKAAVCHSDSSKLQNFVKKKKISSPSAEQEERISALEDLATKNHEEWNEYRQEVSSITQKAENTLEHLDLHRKNIVWLLREVEDLKSQLESIQNQDNPITEVIQQNSNIINLLLKEELTKRRADREEELDKVLTKLDSIQELVGNTKIQMEVVEETLWSDRTRMTECQGTMSHNLEMLQILRENITHLQVSRDELLLSVQNIKLVIIAVATLGIYILIHRYLSSVLQRRPNVIRGQ